MYVSQRTKIIVGAAVAIVIVLIGLLVWQRSTTPSEGGPIQPGQLSPTAGENKLVVDARQPQTEPVDTIATAPELTGQQQSAIAAETLARTFAERFGSYRAPNDFSGVFDMQPFMTPSLQSWSKQFIRDQSGQTVTVVTRALSVATQEYTDTAATLVVSTQRQENRSGQPTKEYKQDLKLQLQYQNGQWLIDAAYWQ